MTVVVLMEYPLSGKHYRNTPVRWIYGYLVENGSSAQARRPNDYITIELTICTHGDVVGTLGSARTIHRRLVSITSLF